VVVAGGSEASSGVDILEDRAGGLHVCSEASDGVTTRLVHVLVGGSTEVVAQWSGSPGARCRMAERASGELLLTAVDPVRRVVRLFRKAVGGTWVVDDVDPEHVPLGPQEVLVDASDRPWVLFVTTEGTLRRAR